MGEPLSSFDTRIGELAKKCQPKMGFMIWVCLFGPLLVFGSVFLVPSIGLVSSAPQGIHNLGPEKIGPDPCEQPPQRASVPRGFSRRGFPGPQAPETPPFPGSPVPAHASRLAQPKRCCSPATMNMPRFSQADSEIRQAETTGCK